MVIPYLNIAKPINTLRNYYLTLLPQLTQWISEEFKRLTYFDRPEKMPIILPPSNVFREVIMAPIVHVVLRRPLETNAYICNHSNCMDSPEQLKTKMEESREALF